MSQTVNIPGPFDEAGRLVCWRCFGPTINRPSGQPGTFGKVFYKCQNKPQVQCERFFKWQEDVDELRRAHGIPDPAAAPATPHETASAPTTLVATAPSTPAAARSSSQPTQPAGSQPSGPQSAPARGGRVQGPINLNATPIVTPQRHLSRQGTAETVTPAAPGPAPAPAPAVAPAPTTPSRRRAPSPSPPPEAEVDDEVVVETHATDDDYENVTLLRTPRSDSRVYPTLASTQGSPPEHDGSPVARKRQRMPGAFTSSTDSSGPTATGRIHNWRSAVTPSAPSMADRRRDVFSSPPPTQDTAPAPMDTPSPLPPLPSTPSRHGGSTATRMHGLSSPAPTPSTIRLSEPGTPSVGTMEEVAHRISQDAMLLSRRVRAAEASSNYKEGYIKELEAEKQKLLDERAAMQQQHAEMTQELQKKLADAYQEISRLQKKLSGY
ncbi:hypothetical protein AURDEDRAFT_114931 [Auricularia subglabra TFB-10046 SS5]|nr:hypothetical protein AURDEDRAFT_114931 [Auricularia subglabra TFB-10046 SS5]